VQDSDIPAELDRGDPTLFLYCWDGNGSLVGEDWLRVMLPRWGLPLGELTPLEEARAAALAAIKARRKQAEYGGFVYEGQRWDSEEKDELRLNSIITMMGKTGLTSFENWKISDAEYITLTPTIAGGAAAALMMHYAACFAVEAQKQAEIAALTTTRQILDWQATNINTGWPG
jgi:hypothetical protein